MSNRGIKDGIEMDANSEHIETKHPHKNRGVKINKEAYAAVADLMMRHIEYEEEVTLAVLITQAEQSLKIYPNIVWMVYHVKLDLEARGLIHLIASTTKRNSFVLRLITKALRQKEKPFTYYQ